MTTDADVISRPVETSAELLELLPDSPAVTSWVLRGEGLVGWGEHARYEPSGPGRFADAQRWWSAFTGGLRVHDDVRLPGSGPVAFTSMAFADDPGRSVLVVPRVVVGRANGVTWLTSFEHTAWPHGRQPPREPRNLRYSAGMVPVTRYRAAVAEAVRRIGMDALHKVVLAHDLLATSDCAIDPRFLLRGLAAAYPDCWCYAVASLVGATPELLLRKQGMHVSARLLAGTTWPGSDAEGALMTSAKNRAEHGYGVDSLRDSLRGFCSTLRIPDEPTVMRLRNVAHLASAVEGALSQDTPLLRLAEAVHPTAAVGGEPREAAIRAIADLELMDRGRYAGPVGWIDAHGDGEFGVALRCAQLDGHTARLFAGCGIVAGSDPDTEAAEAEAKFVPVRDALAGVR